ncbi:cyclic dehypoxanthinyl futalosine synthase [Aneurinibacillus danicus]|uniref:Cyclic dehypoxanthine futalosine synthase n=1 Tax=Aneurinibacillus danicus TaxID=267746 RepID=A0A511V176_9BACL|nr:cyclic dehypoxanthinyl futalosine synthase [Aneurinibacillus danicus]GEN32640.1 cyclic dehypoxanthine futalosine synthase [Aneurinibacillus danicus]
MAIDQVLERALAGERLGLEDGLRLYDSNEIEKLGHYANKIMEKWHPEPIATFVIGRNINYTNVCDTYCRFCAFYRAPGSEEGYVLPDEEIYKKIQETVDVQGTEILMQGGTNPNLPLEYYTNLLRGIKQRFPSIQMHSLSVAEIVKIAEVSNKPVEEVIHLLHEAGLDSLPGAGAEILDDRTRKKISRLKGTWQQWIDVMKMANREGMSTTATMVIGFGESMEERVLHLLRVREAQDEMKAVGGPGFLAFISWTFQPENTNMKAEKQTPEQYLKNVAISRIMIDNIPNFQSSWVTMGPDVGKLSLSYGCNDFGSTMMEENVVSAAACTYKVNTNHILQLIREAGKIPAQRNTKYEILRVFKEGESMETDFVMQN